MIQKVFISEQNTAEFICSACNKYHKMDISQYLEVPDIVKLKVKCKCGYSWTVMLEKRKFFRKKTNLRGKYRYQVTGKQVVEGDMTVLDISRTGLKLKIHGKHNLKDGDWIEVEFRLDNQVQSLINRIVNIKNVSGEYLGVSLKEVKRFDPVIGFYMLQHTPIREK